MLPVKIAGLGWYLPERRVPNVELEERLRIPAGWIERVTGVRERRYATHETAVGMGGAASRMALAEAGLDVGDIDAIIGASAAPQQMIPCTAALMQRELEAPDGASACFDVNATCLSFLFALQTASHLVASGMYRNVLIFSSEIGSRSLNPRERESAVLFGDAAAAAVVTRSMPGESSAVWHSQFTTYSSGADLTAILGGGNLHHPNDPATTPEMNMFHMRGPAVFKLGLRVLAPFVDRFFAGLELDRRKIDAVVPHQASRHAVELLTGHLGFEERQVVWNLAERGNCIAASIPLALAESVHSGRITRGDRLLLIGSGAGLTLGAVALTF
ncbi:MAG: beta-ketoacyl-ACP synthase 3 [Chloroflexota bacterium]|nr:beta-ketoacyl-ACP synthase 3 [Chloroflexota bacterium]MDQ5866411.1 beta-ketoacyl-ACP synthase 3 [Chloroflexota bacterium]